jgi:hypothetical protein
VRLGSVFHALTPHSKDAASLYSKLEETVVPITRTIVFEIRR